MDYPGKVITKTQVTPTQTSASGNWTLDDQAAAIKNNNWPVALVPNPISKSLRFNSADAAYLNRTFNTPTDNKKWTWSCWLKRSGFGGSGQYLIMTFPDGSNYAYINLTSSQTLELGGQTGGVNFSRVTSAVFRDASAWYAINVVVDTTLATANDRIKIYVNNVLQTLTGTAPNQNVNLVINTAAVHRIGAHTSSANYYLDGYLTEINFIDGQALDPSNFGLTNPQTGQWIPKKYTGTYGTNGFYLNFKDATSTTTLGYDYSGNANNWTTNNFSVTAGSGNDSLTDVPTPWTAYNTTGDVGGVVRGNYCTWNPLVKFSFSTSFTGTYSNGNLDIATGGNSTQFAGTMGLFDGCYWEVTATSIDVNRSYIGIVATQSNMFSSSSAVAYNGTYNVLYSNDGYVYVNTTSGSNIYGTFATWTNNDVISVAFKDGKIYFAKNGTWINSGVPASGTGFVASGWNAYGTLLAYAGYNSNYTGNFGQRPFAYTPPAGFRSLCTTNLPATTIGFGLTNQGNNYFNATTYTGTGSSLTVTNSGSMQPDLVWIKTRSTASRNTIFDAIRGTNKILWSDSTDAEGTANAGTGLTAFASNGFTLGTEIAGTSGSVNTNTQTYVAWQWRASNATAVTNTAGSITSTVSANTTAGFSIVTYSGAGTTSSTIGHGLGVAPSMFIIKCRNNFTGATIWPVYHASVGNTAYLDLSSTNAASTLTAGWNNTSPTSTVFTVGSAAGVNGSGNTFVAYCFAAVPGYSAFGLYTGNGSADGPFIYIGFRPRYVMFKRTNSTGNWIVEDTSRSPYNQIDDYISANASSAGATGAYYVDYLSNGFKLRYSDPYGDTNASGSTYIYAAFAESPFQFSNAR